MPSCSSPTTRSCVAMCSDDTAGSIACGSGLFTTIRNCMSTNTTKNTPRHTSPLTRKGQTGHRIGFGDPFEDSDQGFDSGDDGLNGAKVQGCVVGGVALPDFGDPEDVFAGGIFGDDVTETARHVGGTLGKESDEFLALA